MRALSWGLVPLAICAAVSCAHAAAELGDTSGRPEAQIPAEQPAEGRAVWAPATPGRFQLVVVTGHPGSPFLIDTATGCLWSQVRNEETRRSTFVEVDVENLHWGWGTGTQSLLAGRIDASQVRDDQKHLLKENLRKSGCGVSGVVLTPDLRPRLTQGTPDAAPADTP